MMVLIDVSCKNGVKYLSVMILFKSRFLVGRLCLSRASQPASSVKVFSLKIRWALSDYGSHDGSRAKRVT